MQGNIRAKKSLGQNFLKSGAILGEIVKAGEVSSDDFIVEIGPGKGSLTKKLLETGATVLAIEKDYRLIEFLNEKFEESISTKKLQILEGDVLELDLEKDLPENFLNKKYKLVANIPYYITGLIIEKFLSSKNSPVDAILMVQKEVCDRIVARDNKESILSMSVKAYSEPKYIKKVPAKFFSPAPRVDSAIIKLGNISKKVFEENNVLEDVFFKIVRAGFSHKRKILISNLKEWQKKNSNKARTDQNTKIYEIDFSEKFNKQNIDLKIRAENLQVKDWINLIK